MVHLKGETRRIDKRLMRIGKSKLTSSTKIRKEYKPDQEVHKAERLYVLPHWSCRLPVVVLALDLVGLLVEVETAGHEPKDRAIHYFKT